MRTLRINYTHYDEEQQDDPVFLEILERHLNRTGPDCATPEQIEESQKEYEMSNYREIIESIEKRKNEEREIELASPLNSAHYISAVMDKRNKYKFEPRLGMMERYKDNRREQVIRELAYIKAERDNFIQSPVSYWLSAEQDVKEYYEHKLQ